MSIHEKIKIGYFADGLWSHQAFDKIIMDNDLSIAFICARYNTADETLESLARKYSIDYLKHHDVNSKQFIEMLKKYDCDLFVSMSFNQIFKKEIINLPRLKIINCHAGKLPFYRGRNVLNWVLINGEKEFGITVHYVDEGIDTGDIILQRVYPIADDDNYSTLLNKAYRECASLLYDAISNIKDNKVEVVKQSTINPIGSYCLMRKEGDELINWNKTSREIFNFIRAICDPGPKARSFIKGREIKINKAVLMKDCNSYNGSPGYIVGKDEQNLFVKTVDSIIGLSEYEYKGSINIGDRFE